jgi:dUTP pyrophosphatase
MQVKIKKLHPDAIVPKYQTSGSAGFDIHIIEDAVIYPGETRILKTGLSFEIPEGYELQIVPRSGISAKSRLRISNSPGTVDSDFRGEVGIIVDNIDFSSDKRIPHTIKKGDRVAQGKITPVIQAVFVEIDQLNETERGAGGFGSTGINYITNTTADVKININS